MGRYNKTGIGAGVGTSGQLDFTNLSLIQKGGLNVYNKNNARIFT